MTDAITLSGLILLTGSLFVAFMRRAQGRPARSWMGLAGLGLLLVLISLSLS